MIMLTVRTHYVSGGRQENIFVLKAHLRLTSPHTNCRSVGCTVARNFPRLWCHSLTNQNWTKILAEYFPCVNSSAQKYTKIKNTQRTNIASHLSRRHSTKCLCFFFFRFVFVSKGANVWCACESTADVCYRQAGRRWQINNFYWFTRWRHDTGRMTPMVQPNAISTHPWIGFWLFTRYVQYIAGQVYGMTWILAYYNVAVYHLMNFAS